MEFLITFGVVFTAIIILIASIRLVARMKHLDYVRDVIDGIEWLWEYDSSYGPINIKPYCQKCGTELVYEDEGFSQESEDIDGKIKSGMVTKFYCATCDNSFNLIRSTGIPQNYLTRLKIEKNIRDLREFRSGKSRKR